MATRSKTTTFGLACCPFCHDEEAILTIDLADLDAIRCASCDAEFSALAAYEKATEEAARWAKVVRWSAMAREVIASEA